MNAGNGQSETPLIRLYVAGDSPSSLAAREIVDDCVSGDIAGPGYEVVDVLLDPARALEANLIATPTLILEYGGRERRYVGDLRRQTGLQRVLRELGESPPNER